MERPTEVIHSFLLSQKCSKLRDILLLGRHQVCRASLMSDLWPGSGSSWPANLSVYRAIDEEGYISAHSDKNPRYDVSQLMDIPVPWRLVNVVRGDLLVYVTTVDTVFTVQRCGLIAADGELLGHGKGRRESVANILLADKGSVQEMMQEVKSSTSSTTKKLFFLKTKNPSN